MTENQMNSKKPQELNFLTDYPPSWFDKFSRWVETLPIPYWIVYLMISIILLAIGVISRYIGGYDVIKGWDPIIFVAIFQICILFTIIHYLDKYALRALDEFRPAIRSDKKDIFPDLQRVISTMPAGKTLLVCMIFMGFGLILVLATLFSGASSISTINVGIDPFGIFTASGMLLLWFTNGLLAFHTVHQLLLVDHIYTDLTIVHPFHQRELFAFSGFSARTGVALVLITPLWIIFDPGPVSLVICIIFTIFGLVAFIYPLIGVHNILVKEKDALLDENGREIENIIANLMEAVKKQADLTTINQSLTSLEKAKGQIERISTWPWKTETVRQLITAIILPLLIWLVQFLLSAYIL